MSRGLAGRLGLSGGLAGNLGLFGLWTCPCLLKMKVREKTLTERLLDELFHQEHLLEFYGSPKREHLLVFYSTP